MDPSEIEFLAERQNISIIPKFTSNNILHLISGDIGPFRAGLPVVVPLWVAVNLRQRQKCRIVPPDWMNIERLLEKKEEEKSSRLFTKMPDEHYMEVAHMLLSVAGDDIERPDEIRTAVKDLWDIRVSKLRSSVDTFIKSHGRTARVDHLTQLEINSVRPLLPDALNIVHDLQTEDAEDQTFYESSTFISQQ
ncbi:probable DNA replication complex GINS protein PSF2 [Homalodisca vitripennis]|uniref:DNA replication complex GINS protein PSF2 n=1 Tax=Homalodisca liturata TaxID=320908 RepID=A0A1B6HLC3_9HEMI|nr:probable DNA replication complex GINS protein PSF2 [Homalodisca vitripennis]